MWTRYGYNKCSMWSWRYQSETRTDKLFSLNISLYFLSYIYFSLNYLFLPVFHSLHSFFISSLSLAFSQTISTLLLVVATFHSPLETSKNILTFYRVWERVKKKWILSSELSHTLSPALVSDEGWKMESHLSPSFVFHFLSFSISTLVSPPQLPFRRRTSNVFFFDFLLLIFTIFSSRITFGICSERHRYLTQWNRVHELSGRDISSKQVFIEKECIMQ